MTTQHTPGPWIVRYREAGLKKPKLSVEHSNPHGAGVIGLTLALLPLTVSHAAESRANARLIASAPNLLEAAKDTWAVLVAEFGHGRAETNFGKLRAAIARATGDA